MRDLEAPRYPDRDDDEAPPRRVIVTLHYPVDMHCAAMVMKAVADAYPHAVVGEDGTIWDRPGAANA